MKPHLGTILETIEHQARPLIRERYRIDSCVASTRVVCRVLEHFDIEARPLMVKLRLMDEIMIRKIAGEDVPKGGYVLTLGATAEDSGIWTSREEALWKDAGHMIALLPKHGIFIDASLDQAQRPQHGVNPPPVLIGRYDSDFGTVAGSHLSKLYDTFSMDYESFPQARQYLKSPDWTEKARTGAIVMELIRRIKIAQSSES